MRNKDIFRTIVICSTCGRMADFRPPSKEHPWPQYILTDPCPQCGAYNYAAHDTDRDWKTGKKIWRNLGLLAGVLFKPHILRQSTLHTALL